MGFLSCLPDRNSSEKCATKTPLPTKQVIPVKSGTYIRIRELKGPCSKKNVGKGGQGQTELGFPAYTRRLRSTRGVRMWSNVIGCPRDEVRIGDPVELVHEDVTEAFILPRFCRVR